MKAWGSVACADSGNAPLFVSTVRSGTHWPLPAEWEMLVVTCALGPGGSAENNIFLLCPSLPPLSAPLTLTEVNPSTAAKLSQRSHPASQARVVLIWPPSEKATLLWTSCEDGPPVSGTKPLGVLMPRGHVPLGFFGLIHFLSIICLSFLTSLSCALPGRAGRVLTLTLEQFLQCLPASVSLAIKWVH